MTFAAEEPGQILRQDAQGRVLVSRERRELLLEEYGGSPSLDRELALYEKYVVDYYDQGPKSDDEIRADISELRRKWPSRVYQIKRVVRTEYDSKEDIGTVVIQYNYEVSNGVKRKTGEMETFLVFGTVSKQPRVILVTEHNVR